MQYFGTTEELMMEVRAITETVFRTFTARACTEADVITVFQCITENHPDPVTGTWSMAIVKDKVNLLMYAFEQANMAGKPGNWNYINGVLAQLSRQGITSLAEANE